MKATHRPYNPATRKTAIAIMLSAAAAAMVLAGCSSVDRVRGRTKQSPDEFRVVVRPSLTLPPGFDLNPLSEEAGAAAAQRPPQRRRDTDAISAARTALGTENAGAGGAGNAAGFDEVFGTAAALPDIRGVVDRETIGIARDRRLPHQALFGGTPPPVGPVLSAEEEARRIEKLRQQGQDLTSTPTPAIDPQSRDSLIVQ